MAHVCAAVPRVALVVGIDQGHRTSVGADASEMAKALREVGFVVIQGSNNTRAEIEALVATFRTQLEPGGVAVFYYSGHGGQINGVNYLRPIASAEASLADVKHGWINLDTILAVLSSVPLQARFVFIDACRENPFLQQAAASGGSDVWIRGLAYPQATARETVISFATSPGEIALDYGTSLSKYTQALSKFIREPGLRADDLFKKVGLWVEGATADSQVPWVNTSSRVNFYFRQPVYILAVLDVVDDELLILIDGDEVFASGVDGSNPKRIPLRAGANQLTIKIYNQHTFTGGVDLSDVSPGLPPGPGHLPEGWRYRLRFMDLNGTQLEVFQDGEERPRKNGPRHGHMFTVATAEIYLDELTGNVTFNALDKDVWKRVQ